MFYRFICSFARSSRLVICPALTLWLPLYFLLSQANLFGCFVCFSLRLSLALASVPAFCLLPSLSLSARLIQVSNYNRTHRIWPQRAHMHKNRISNPTKWIKRAKLKLKLLYDMWDLCDVRVCANEWRYTTRTHDVKLHTGTIETQKLFSNYCERHDNIDDDDDRRSTTIYPIPIVCRHFGLCVCVSLPLRVYQSTHGHTDTHTSPQFDKCFVMWWWLVATRRSLFPHFKNSHF